MAKVVGLPGQRKTVRIVGKVNTAIHGDGRVFIKAWPSKRPGPGTEAQAASRATWSWAIKSLKNMVDPDVVFATNRAPGTMYYPRDILTMAIFGNLMTIYTSDGRVIYGARMAAKSVQALLDQITTTPNSLIWRSPDGWIALEPPTEPDLFLGNTGPGGRPIWTPASGGGGSSGIRIPVSMPAQGTVSNTGFATRGNVITAKEACTVSALSFLINSVVGAKYAAFIAELSGHTAPATITALTYSADSAVTTAAVTEYISAPFTTPITLVAGKDYMLGLSRVDLLGTTILTAFSQSSGIVSIDGPFIWRTYGRATIARVAVGNTIDLTGTAGAQSIGAISLDWTPQVVG